MANGKTPEQMLQETYDKVGQIWVVLCGVPNTRDGGLLQEFGYHCKSDSDFRAEYYRFKKQVLGVFFFLMGSGVLGTTVWQVADALAKGD